MPHNDRGYGHWRFAGAFAVVKRQRECGSKTAEMHVSQPMNIGVCYQLAVGCIWLFSCRENLATYIYATIDIGLFPFFFWMHD